MGTGCAELIKSIHSCFDLVATEGAIATVRPLAKDAVLQSFQPCERLCLAEAVEEFLGRKSAALQKMAHGRRDGGLCRVGLVLALIAHPDLRAGKATARKERFQPQLIALLHRGIDFLSGEAVEQGLVFCFVRHICLFGQE